MQNGLSGMVRPSRRTFVKMAAGAALFPLPGVIGQARADEPVRILGVSTAALDDWSGFEKAVGAKIEFTGIGADTGEYRREIVANRAGETQDIFIINGGMAEEFKGGFLSSVDTAKLSGWQSINPGIRDSPILRDAAGQVFVVPAITNADSFAFYPQDSLGSEPLSWSVIFEDDRTKGKVALEDFHGTTLTMAAVYCKVAKGMAIADPTNMTKEEAAKVVDFLIERKNAGQFRSLWKSFDESVDILGRREVVAATCWEPAVKKLQADGKDIRYARAKEGYFKWLIGAYVAKEVEDRGNTDAVYRVLDGFLGGYYAAEVARLRGYVTGRTQAGLEYAKANGYSAADVKVLEDNVRKVEDKFASEYIWYNSTPTHLSDIEGEWDRFRQA